MKIRSPDPQNAWWPAASCKAANMGCAMAQAASHRPLTAEARVRSRVSPCWVCGGQSDTGTGFPRVHRFSPVNSIPPVFHYKEKRRNLIIFITRLHNKPQGCGESVESAAGPSRKKNNNKQTAAKINISDNFW
jgi:hypothetical protein